MPAWLYAGGPNAVWIFLLVTVGLGGLAALATGRAIASTWRAPWQIVAYAVLLTLAVRFLHYALFHEVLLSVRNLAVDFLVVLAIAWAGFTDMRRRQMRDCYPWVGPSIDPAPLSMPAR